MTEVNKYAVEIRDRSGKVSDARPLVRFLYDLFRDHIPTGVAEKLVVDSTDDDITVTHYSNGWLAAYCQDLADRLTQSNLTVEAEDLHQDYRGRLIAMIEKRVWQAYDKAKSDQEEETCPEGYWISLRAEVGTFSSTEFGGNVVYRPWRMSLSFEQAGPPGYRCLLMANYLKVQSAKPVPAAMQDRLDMTGAYLFDLRELSHSTLFAVLQSLEQL